MRTSHSLPAVASVFSFFLLNLLVAAPPVANAQSEWYKKATEAFPDLAHKDSALNKKFVELYTLKKTSDPGFFAAPDWPLRLAQSASLLLAEPKPVMPSKAEAPVEGLALAPDWAKVKVPTTAIDRERRASFQRLLSPYGQPSTDVSEVSNVEFCQGFRYLMPLKDLISTLNLGKPSKPKVRITSPCWPAGMFVTTFTGSFKPWPALGPYSTMQVITDMKDQIASVQFMNEKRGIGRLMGGPVGECRLYEFVEGRLNQSKKVEVHYFPGVGAEQRGPYSLAEMQKKRGFAYVNVALTDIPKGEFDHETVWYIPLPLLNAMLHCCSGQ